MAPDARECGDIARGQNTMVKNPVLIACLPTAFNPLNRGRLTARPLRVAAAVCVLCAHLLGGVVQAHAAQDQKLYNVGVDVASRSLEDRRAGAAKGLEVMLTRLSGLTDLPRSKALSRALASPDRYYAQYRYYSTDRYDELGQPLTQLNVQFSPPAMRSLMLEAQLPLWTLNRPRVAVWLAEQSGGGTDIIEDPEHPLLAAVLDRASFRGLPAVVPGIAGVSAREVMNRDSTALRAAADRVGAELVLIGRAEQLGPDDWQVRWTSWGRTGSGNGRSLNLQGSLMSSSTPAVDSVVNELVNEFTVAGGEAGTLELIVENIDAVNAYAQMLKYLSSRSYIERVDVAGLSGDELSVLVTTTGSAEKLMQLLAIDSRLIKSTRPVKSRALSSDPAPTSLPGTPSEDTPEYGSRSAIPVTVIADERLRMAWQG